MQPRLRSRRGGGARRARGEEKRDLAERLLEGTDVVGRLTADELVELVRPSTMSPITVESSDEEREIGPELSDDEAP